MVREYSYVERETRDKDEFPTEHDSLVKGVKTTTSGSGHQQTVSSKLDLVLENLSDSEDEDKSDNPDEDDIIFICDISKSSLPSTPHDNNSNTTKKKKESSVTPFEFSYSDLFLIAHNMTCSRWQKINGLDLNFSGPTLSGN